jgi:RNA-directed DNA polymerase
VANRGRCDLAIPREKRLRSPGCMACESQSQTNPSDPAWGPSDEKRLDDQSRDPFKGKHGLSRLWKEQNGWCPIGQQNITKITGWRSHHREWRSKGGPNTAENQVPIHPTGHQHGHSQG